jgi:predicted  nucleic acid-binding Zn-ribbon protein
MDIKIVEDVPDVEAYLMAFDENRMRKDLTPIEESRAFRTMIQKGRMSIAEISLRTKNSESYVKERLSLLELPVKIQDLMADGKVPIRYATALRKLNEYAAAQKDLVHMIATHDYRIKKVEDAEEAADGFVAREKQIIELGKKWGPCPKCGGTRLESESWEKNRVGCLKCGHNFDRHTKEPWDISKVRHDLKELGIKMEISDGTATITPQTLTQILKEREAEAKRQPQLKRNFRSKHTVSELLAPFLLNDNLLSIRVTGDKIEISLVQDSKLHFSARRHNYESGEKSVLHWIEPWQDESKFASLTRVHQYEQNLHLE